MRKFLILFLVLVLQLHSLAFGESIENQCDINKMEWELAKCLIENYQNGQEELRVKADLNKVSVMRIYYYVYSVLPERLDIKSNIENQEIWIEVRGNQNHAMSMIKAKEVNQTILNENMTELEKIAAIHNWIVLNTEFDSHTAATSKSITVENMHSYCANGVFAHKKAVCAGYASAFKMMCEDAEIPCFIINSYTKNHTWNVVYYDGAYRFIDLNYEGKKNDTIYKYFMLNENELPKSTHQLDLFSETTLSAKEYFDFYSYYMGKKHNDKAKSVHNDVMAQLDKSKNISKILN